MYTDLNSRKHAVESRSESESESEPMARSMGIEQVVVLAERMAGWP